MSGTLALDEDNIVIGDNGLVLYSGASGDGFDGDDATLDLVTTTAPTFGGGNDVIKTGDSADVVIAGSDSFALPVNSMDDAADTVLAGDGDNVVMADNGQIKWFGGKLKQILSTENGVDATVQGGDDQVTTASGNDTIVGGYGADTILSGDGNNLVLGDSVQFDFGEGTGTLLRVMTLAPSFGGIDSITSGIGNDVVLGGNAGDTLSVSEGNNIVLGDDGFITYTGSAFGGTSAGDDADAGDIDEIISTSTTLAGGEDSITSGAGQDLIIGGRAGDTINAGNGDNLVIGDSGRIRAASTGAAQLAGLPMTLGRIETIEYADGGADIITTQLPLNMAVDTHPFSFRSIDILNSLGGGDDILAGNNGEDIVLGGQRYDHRRCRRRFDRRAQRRRRPRRQRPDRRRYRQRYYRRR